MMRMNDDEINSMDVEQVVAIQQEAPVNDDAIQESIEGSLQDIPVEQAPEKVSQQEINIRNLRKQAERAEFERERAERAEEALRIAYSGQKQHVPQVQEEEYDLNVDDDALIEGKQLKVLVNEIKNLKKAVKGYEEGYQKTAAQTLEIKLHTQYPDYTQVVTHDNLVQLREMNPDLADAILSQKDQFKQAKLAYDMVKSMGIYKDNGQALSEKLIRNNATKPRPASSIAPTQTSSPISKVNAFADAPLTEEMKEMYRQEMAQAIRNRR